MIVQWDSGLLLILYVFILFFLLLFLLPFSPPSFSLFLPSFFSSFFFLPSPPRSPSSFSLLFLFSFFLFLPSPSLSLPSFFLLFFLSSLLLLLLLHSPFFLSFLHLLFLLIPSPFPFQLLHILLLSRSTQNPSSVVEFKPLPYPVRHPSHPSSFPTTGKYVDRIPTPYLRCASSAWGTRTPELQGRGGCVPGAAGSRGSGRRGLPVSSRPVPRESHLLWGRSVCPGVCVA